LAPSRPHLDPHGDTRIGAGEKHDHTGHAQAHDDPHRGHSHILDNFGPAFAIGTALNVDFVIDETIFGLRANSVALLADAGHNLSDVLRLLIAQGASILATRGPTARRTYGLRSSSILAALANAIVLLVALGAVAWKAIGRMSQPQPQGRPEHLRRLPAHARRCEGPPVSSSPGSRSA